MRDCCVLVTMVDVQPCVPGLTKRYGQEEFYWAQIVAELFKYKEEDKFYWAQIVSELFK